LTEPTESLRARDERVYSQRYLPATEYLRHASRTSGRSPVSLAMEFLKLQRGPGRMTLREYVQLGLYDPALTDEERARFITDTIHWPVTHQCGDLTWQAATEDKWLSTRLLEGTAAPMPRSLAVIDRSSRSYPGTPILRTPAGLRDFILARVRDGAAIFGKENRGVAGFGTFLVEEADHERLHLEGEGWFGYEHFLEKLAGDTVYLLQPVVRNHPFFDRYTERLATVRVGLMVTGAEHPDIPYTVLKVPAKGHTSDHFWREGNLACEVDPKTGEILRARTKDHLGTTDYTDQPETGVRIVGETLPHWGELLDLARAGAQIFAPVRYQSMDVAITPDGPSLIEINSGGAFDLPQLASGRGLLTDEVQAFFAACGVRLRGWK